ncbi:MAG: hypothetical protein M3N32_05875 [Actinomycetota bacterium]|nr:hypothetical protein [Actinomycetota bacterium]
MPGQAPPCIDLAWYLAINASRLPEGKDAAAARYRESLERRGTETGPWWHQQLGLCLLGAFLLLGWEKALGDRDELAWWERRVLDGAQWLR